MEKRIFRGIVSKTGPGLAIQEVLYGFIMALIYVTAARIGVLQYSDTTNLIILIIGMNFTWGAIDAVVFYLIDVFNQRKFIRLMTTCDLSRESRIDMMVDEFDETPMALLKPDSRREICEMILVEQLECDECIRQGRRDMRDSAFACFVITILTTIPIVLPLALIPDIEIALFFASSLSSICLFFIGFRMEKYLGVNRWVAGLFLAALGWSITLISTFTGG